MVALTPEIAANLANVFKDEIEAQRERMEALHAYVASINLGITSDRRTWAVDWSKPIEWNDGTPAELYGQITNGQAHVIVDPLNLPAGALKSAIRYVTRRNATETQGALYATAFNIIAAYGTPADGSCACWIVNTHHREEAEAMQAAPIWGSF